MVWSVRLVGVEDDGYAFVVGLSEDADGTGRTVLFMCPVEPDEEVTPDQDTYCTVNQDQATIYGGIRAVAIGREWIDMTVSPEFAEELGLPGEQLRWPLAIPDDQFGALVDGMTRVLTHGSPPEQPSLTVR